MIIMKTAINHIITVLGLIFPFIVFTGCEEKQAVDPDSVQEIQVEPLTMDMYHGKTARISYTVVPETAVFDKVYFAVDDRSVIRVDETGTVTALAVGEAVVTVTAGGKTGTCNVTVLPAVAEQVFIEMEEAELEIGQTLQIVGYVLPDEVEDKTLEWTSSAPEVASVDETGLVTALSEGESVIKASSGDVYDEVKVTVIKPVPKIGDFFYFDGTFSTELDESKEAIGLVFWVGDPAKDDEALRREHPECVNGLVVAFEDAAKETAWQSWYTDYGKTVGEWIEQNTDYASITTSEGINQPLNKMVGYNNTQGMKAFNADDEHFYYSLDIVDALSSWTVAAPENTSGWYIPSAKELTLLCSGEYNDDIMYMPGDMLEIMNQLNVVLASIGKPSIGGYYWSSTEMDWELAVLNNFIAGNIWTEYKEEYWGCNLRLILAF